MNEVEYNVALGGEKKTLCFLPFIGFVLMKLTFYL